MKTKEIFFQKVVETIIFNKHLRPFAVKQLDNYMFNKFSQTDSNVIYDEKMRMKRYQFYSAILNVANNNLGKGYYSKTVMKKMSYSLTGSKFVMKAEDKIGEIQIDYKSKYGDYPPGFIVLAP
ncbi:MAG: hypothetical protein IMY71_00355, partial [Bacteroidetes bacterium]|nr:hypothetical protein [Bacteroidota bacterium]